MTSEPTSTATPEPTPVDLPRIQAHRWTGLIRDGGAAESGGAFTFLGDPEVFRTDDGVWLVPDTGDATGIYFLDPFASGSVADAPQWPLSEEGWTLRPNAHRVVDFDGDGRTEILLLGEQEDPWFWGMAAWSAVPDRRPEPSTGPTDGVFAELEGHGVNDACVVADGGTDVVLAPLLGASPTVVLPAGTGCIGFAWGGFLAQTAPDEVSLFPATGHPTLQDRTASWTFEELVDARSVDLDGVGGRDLLVATREPTTGMWRYEGFVGMDEEPAFTVHAEPNLAVGDLDGDGVPDLVASVPTASGEHGVAVLRGPLVGELDLDAPDFEFLLGEPSLPSLGVTLHDLRGDGRMELVVADRNWNVGAGAITIADWDAIVATADP